MVFPYCQLNHFVLILLAGVGLKMLINYSHMISPVAAAPPEYSMGCDLMLPYRFPAPMEGTMKQSALATNILFRKWCFNQLYL